MRLISERISVEESKNSTIVILGTTERWKESLLLFWVLAWSFSGAVYLYYFFADTAMQYNLAMMVMLSFWLYFEVKIMKVFLWRRVGFERITFLNDEIIIQNNLYGRGKKKRYFINNIDDFMSIITSSKDFFAFMDNSFWVIGGQRVYFDYFGKTVVIAMQIDDLELKKLLSFLNGQLKKRKKEMRIKRGRNKE